MRCLLWTAEFKLSRKQVVLRRVAGLYPFSMCFCMLRQTCWINSSCIMQMEVVQFAKHICISYILCILYLVRMYNLLLLLSLWDRIWSLLFNIQSKCYFMSILLFYNGMLHSPQPPCRGHYSDCRHEIQNKVTLSWCMWKSISCGHSDTGKMKFLYFLHSNEKRNWQPHFLDKVIASEVQTLDDCYVYWYDREHSILSNCSVCIT